MTPDAPFLPTLTVAHARRALAAVTAATIVAAGAFAAQAALLLLAPRATAAPRPLVSRAVPAAIVAPVDRMPLPSPARGATGTAPLPPTPVVSAAADTGVVAAAPFSLHGIAAADRGRAVECLAAAIYYEAGSEPVDGQRAVAQAVLNRVRHPAFPATVCGVVYQGSERAGCQFSFACDGAMARAPSRGGWARATRVAAAALAGAVYAPVGLATHYHTFAVTPAWNRGLVMTDAVGAHFFHRWKGYWGTRAAFAQRYRGHEPLPGPHPTAPTPAEAVAIVAPVAVSTPIPAPVVAVPRRASAAAPVLPESQVLDRWKDSGQPLDRR
ncbi:cell wall hydrolase [Sphingomonas adhaesiva]|uniref:cell wall hydrolase n=1 Tax=Sphingomonas adhaesiva TaxID=28212 RepID=UPI002FF9A22B